MPCRGDEPFCKMPQIPLNEIDMIDVIQSLDGPAGDDPFHCSP